MTLGAVNTSGIQIAAMMAPMTNPTLNPPHPRSQSVTVLFSARS